MKEVIEILESLNLGVDVETCDELVDGGILASLDLVTLVSELSETFDITVPARELKPENFNSAAAIWEMVQRLQDE